MKWTTGPMFRMLMRTALFTSLSWLVLLELLSGKVVSSVSQDLRLGLVAVAALSGIFTFVLSGTPDLRRPATKEWQGSAQIVIRRTPEQVWQFIKDPTYAPATSEIIERAFSIPGTPEGAGHQQVFISAGPFNLKQVSLIEIVSETPFIEASVKNLTSSGWSRYELESVSEGTRLTITMANDYKRWTPHAISPTKHLEGFASDYVQRVKRVIESGAVSIDLESTAPHQPTRQPPTSLPSFNTPPPFKPGDSTLPQ